MRMKYVCSRDTGRGVVPVMGLRYDPERRLLLLGGPRRHRALVDDTLAAMGRRARSDDGKGNNRFRVVVEGATQKNLDRALEWLRREKGCRLRQVRRFRRLLS